MRRTLHFGTQSFDLRFGLGPAREEAGRLAAFQAQRLLRRAATDPAGVRTLRHVLAEVRPGLMVARLTDAEVVEALARVAAAGSLVVVALPSFHPSLHGAGAADDAEGTPASAEPVKAKTWIEIRLVDADKNPVPGARYLLKVPGGLELEGWLDGVGHARIDGLDPGTCEVTFPDLDASEGDG